MYAEIIDPQEKVTAMFMVARMCMRRYTFEKMLIRIVTISFHTQLVVQHMPPNP